VRPGRLVSPDPWLETGCWRDVPDDQEGVRTCEADPHPESALGLCPDHGVHNHGNRLWSEDAPPNAQKPGGGDPRPGLWQTVNGVGSVHQHGIWASSNLTSEMFF